MDELDKSSVYMTGIKKHDITYQNTFEPADTSVIPYMNEVDGKIFLYLWEIRHSYPFVICVDKY